jgi:GT2 family glycosyltransferase
VAAARSELVALTDDDCAVPADWAAGMVGALRTSERVALAFGNVVPAPHEANGSFIPGYVQPEPLLAGADDLERAVEWVGACMGLRRSAWDVLGGFDEMLGAGARFPAADEADLVIRALAGGWQVYKTPTVWVTHHGLRTREEAHALVGCYARGTGAMMAKHLRCGTPRTASLLGSMARHWLRGDVHPGARVGDGRHRMTRLLEFGRGFLGGATAQVDRSARLFGAPRTVGR